MIPEMAKDNPSLLLVFLPLFTLTCTSVQRFPEEYEWREYYSIYADASSYSDESYLNLVGEPDMEECGSGEGVWMPQFPDEGEIYIGFLFPASIFIKKISIYQGRFTGSLIYFQINEEDGDFTRIFIEDGSGSDCVVYEYEFEDGEEIKGQEIMLAVDTDTHEGEYEEIDTLTIWDYQPRSE